eukprot:m51a1_g1108 hypothetical protein (464) ;mRNA; f:134390-135857
MSAKDRAARWAWGLAADFPQSLRQADFFPFRPTVALRPYRTFYGSFATVFIIALMSFYVATTLRQFITARPVLQQLYAASPNAVLEVPDLAVAVVSSGDNSPVQSPRHWAVSFKRYIIYEQYRGGRASWDMPLSGDCSGATRMLDNAPANYSWLYSCPQRSNLTTVRGQFNDDEYHYIAVTVTSCNNKTMNGTCASVAETLARLKDMAVVFNLVQGDIDDQGRRVQLLWSVKQELLPRSGLVYYTENYLQDWGVVVRSRYMFDPEPKRSFVRVQSAASTLREIDTTAKPVVLWRMYLRVAPLMVTEYRQRRALLDLLGSWGALFGFCLNTVGISAIMWSRMRFFRQLSPVSEDPELVYCRRYMFNDMGRISRVALEEYKRAEIKEDEARQLFLAEMRALHPELFRQPVRQMSGENKVSDVVVELSEAEQRSTTELRPQRVTGTEKQDPESGEPCPPTTEGTAQ